MIVTSPSGVRRMNAFGANSGGAGRRGEGFRRLEQLDVAREQHAAAGNGGDAKE